MTLTCPPVPPPPRLQAGAGLAHLSLLSAQPGDGPRVRVLRAGAPGWAGLLGVSWGSFRETLAFRLRGTCENSHSGLLMRFFIPGSWE